MALHPDFKEFLRLLNSHQVEYLLVGAHALAVHGQPRMTGDIDFFIRSSPGNAARLYAALQEFGFGSTGVNAADLEQPGRIFMLGVLPHRIDLLTSISGVDFEQAWSRRFESVLDGLPVHVLSLEDLVANKRASGRAKDRADLDMLGES